MRTRWSDLLDSSSRSRTALVVGAVLVTLPLAPLSLLTLIVAIPGVLDAYQASGREELPLLPIGIAIGSAAGLVAGWVRIVFALRTFQTRALLRVITLAGLGAGLLLAVWLAIRMWQWGSWLAVPTTLSAVIAAFLFGATVEWRSGRA